MINLLHSFFESISEFFSNLWSILSFILEKITDTFMIIKQSIQFFTSLLGSIPSFFIFFGIATLLVLIVYVIIGRNAGGD